MEASGRDEGSVRRDRSLRQIISIESADTRILCTIDLRCTVLYYGDSSELRELFKL